MLRRRRREPDPLAGVEPVAVGPRWAPAVAAAQASRARFAELVARTPDGPRRAHLAELGHGVDRGVLAVWAAARRASELEAVLAGMQPEAVTADYKAARRARPASDDPAWAALSARFESVQRLLNALDDTAEQLRLLDLQLDAVVARAAEVAFHAGADPARLSRELEDLAGRLDALRAGLDSLG